MGEEDPQMNHYKVCESATQLKVVVSPSRLQVRPEDRL